MKKSVLLVLFAFSFFILAPVTSSFAVSQSPSSSQQTVSKKVNINSASETDLTSIPGVGPATAQKIVDYRKKNGKFKSLNDLTAVKGIGEKSLQKMMPYMTL